MFKKLFAVVFFVLALAWIAGVDFTLNWHMPESRGAITRADVDSGLQVAAGYTHAAGNRMYAYGKDAWQAYKSPEMQEARTKARAAIWAKVAKLTE